MTHRHLTAFVIVIAIVAQSAPASAAGNSYDNGGRAILLGVMLGVTMGIIIKIATAPRSPTSSKKIRATLDPWVGGDINDLIGKWGAPSSTFDTPDGRSRIYTWLYDGGVVVHATGFGSARASQSRCRFEWTTAADRIQSYRWEGSCLVDDRASR